MLGPQLVKTVQKRWRVGSVTKGRAKMDRPEVVVRAQLRHNDDLVQYLLSEARGEVWGGFYPRCG
jgi:hypothetical protein